MTSFVDVRNMVGWVASTGPERIIAGILEYLEQDFARWESFDKTPRVASHTPFGVIELMPTSDHESYAFKYVNGHPSNPARGYQTVTAFGVLADVHNGYPTFLAEMTVLTALRTAATSAFAAKLLARPDSEVMAMVGTGSQAEFQALAFRIALGIRRGDGAPEDKRTAKVACAMAPDEHLKPAGPTGKGMTTLVGSAQAELLGVLADVMREEDWESYVCRRNEDKILVEMEPGSNGLEIVGELARLLFLATIEQRYCEGLGIEQWYSMKLGLEGVE